jgi:hypothetical protein
MSMLPTRRECLRRLTALLPPLALPACVSPGGVLVDGGTRRNAAKWEFHERFLASGARFRYHPYGGQGRAWTAQMEHFYRTHRRDARVGYAVKNLHTGQYLAEYQADRLFFGGSMPKPPIAAMLLEKRQGACSYEEFMHIVYVCDKSLNSSWMVLHSLLDGHDEAAFRWKYHLPVSHILANQLSPRFYAEFFERCVNYRLDHGCELLLEAMRRDQYGFGRLYLPRHITYAGGKTGNYGEWDHEALFFYHGTTPYAVTLFTRGDFSPGKMNLPLGAMMGGLFREYIA